MKVRVSFKLLCLAVVAVSAVAVMAQVTGRTTLTVGSGSQPPSGNQSLLHGATVDANNQPSVAIPSGWTLVQAQGFEGTAPSTESWSGAVSTDRPHTGTHSLQDNVDHDQAGPAWWGGGSTLGTFTSVYLSYWEFVDSNAAANDEWNLGDLTKYDSSGNFMQEISPGLLGQSFNTLTPPLTMGPQSPKPNGVINIYYGPNVNLNPGAWHQWEISWTPNSPGSSNGAFAIYRDGTLLLSASNQNLNGTIDMSGSALRAGGQYTKLLWTNNAQGTGTCTPLGTGTGIEFQGGGTSFASIAAVCQPPAPAFKRFLDDVIVIKR